MRTLFQDIRYGWRMLLKSKAFALVAVMTLALGIGANSAIFSVVHAVLLRPFPLPDPERLMTLWTDLPGFGIEEASIPDFYDWRQQNTAFEDVAGYRGLNLNLSGSGDPERLSGAGVTSGFFRLMGVQPAVGRDFTAEDDKPGAPAVAILSEGFWRRRFGGDPAVLGRAILLNGNPTTVVGLAPPDMGVLRQIDVWVPLAAVNNPNQRRNDMLAVVGRLKPGVSPQQAQARMTAVAASLARQYPATNTGVGIRVISLRERAVGRIRTALLVLWAAVGFVLLIVCANVANLVLARSSARNSEIAVRMALGASRTRLVRQLLTESLLLAVVGGVLGVVLAAWAVDVLKAMGSGIPRIADVRLDRTALAFTAAASLLTGILFGLVPALQMVRPRLHDALKEGGRMAALAGGHARLRRGLAIAELALSLMLLIGAGLMIRSFSQLTHVNPGFRTDGLLTFRVALPATRYNEPAKNRTFAAQALERLRVLPGASAVEAGSNMYIRDGASILSFLVEGAPAPPPDQSPDAHIRAFTPDFQRVMGVRLLKGRGFTARDDASGPLVATVNESFARRYFPGEEVIGKRVSYDAVKGQPQFREIVGIVQDVKQNGLDADVYPEIQVPYEQWPRPGITFVLRSSVPEPAELLAAARRELKILDPELPLFSVTTGEQMLQQSVAERRFQMTLLGIFAAVALVLAAVGIYGVMAQSVAQRTGEFGIRMALGARPADILRLVMKGGAAITAAGLLAGAAGALLATRFLATMLFGVKPTDPLTFAAVAVVLGGVSLLACYLPARRATQVDPIEALRYE